MAPKTSRISIPLWRNFVVRQQRVTRLQGRDDKLDVLIVVEKICSIHWPDIDRRCESISIKVDEDLCIAVNLFQSSDEFTYLHAASRSICASLSDQFMPRTLPGSASGSSPVQSDRLSNHNQSSATPPSIDLSSNNWRIAFASKPKDLFRGQPNAGAGAETRSTNVSNSSQLGILVPTRHFRPQNFMAMAANLPISFHLLRGFSHKFIPCTTVSSPSGRADSSHRGTLTARSALLRIEGDHYTVRDPRGRVRASRTSSTAFGMHFEPVMLAPLMLKSLASLRPKPPHWHSPLPSFVSVRIGGYLKGHPVMRSLSIRALAISGTTAMI